MAVQSKTAGIVPGPRASLLGWRGQTLAFLRDPVAFMSALYRDHGHVAAWLAGNAGWMFGFGPEYNQQVLSDATRFLTVPIAPLATPRDSALARLTNNLLTMNGATHRQQRRLMLPAFHRKRVETYRDEMVAIADHMLSTWQVGQHIDIARAMQRLTLCIASRTLFGADAELDADNIGRLISRWMAMIESGAVFLFPKDWPATPFRHLMKLSNQLEARMLGSIAQKRANPGMHHDVLAMLVQARDEDGASMTDEDLVGQAGVIFVA